MEPILVMRARRGDRDAFADIAAAIGDRLYAVAHRILRDRELAGDATQETLVKIWQELPTLREVDRFDAWSHRLLINACRDELRRQRRTPSTVHLLPHDDPVADASLTVADRDQLERGFRRLTADQRAVVILQYYLDYSLAEIATTLDLPIGTVRSRLHYAKRALRAALDADRRAAMPRRSSA
ncbi:MAG: RNA polymerase sigma factor [Dehalococcoidia bacterium]